ncbi:MAG: hypothetical protein Kow0099_22810 [Candidatus Abyssubacteria bacterium]
MTSGEKGGRNAEDAARPARYETETQTSGLRIMCVGGRGMSSPPPNVTRHSNRCQAKSVQATDCLQTTNSSNYT